ncbi:CopG family ribbon-helix-helix protein [Mycobacterium neglectum]|uniref:CopG family ribbon-helix-helix protein n=1 Tax=Mycobacterium neglectum TaxID=242737 RepID=UPI000BFED4DF|nr:ribbon-helix-helix domain-containing protein [Mycobacterium neglectum]
MNIDQDRYNKLADWAEGADRGIHPERGETSTAATRSSRELIRRAGGRPSVDPASEPGAVSPRRQVRLPRALSERVDQLADRENRSASDLMREAIAQYVATHDEQRAG